MSSEIDVLPFAMVTVSFCPLDIAADVYSTTLGCTKLCVAPLSNMHDTSTPGQVAFNSNKFGHSDEARLDIRAITGNAL